MPLELDAVAVQVKKFASERDWEQFHTPKNLVMALSAEVGELTEIFQWLTPERSSDVMTDIDKARAIEDEIADVLIYLVRLADVLDVDLGEVVDRKMAENAERYPVDRVKGSAMKMPGGER